jgi:hypothetical protein
MESAVDGSGALVAALTPAVYFDASVLIDYWVTEGMEHKADPDMPSRNAPHEDVIRELLKTDKRFAGMVEVRKALLLESLGARAVTSSLALLEVIEWHAESAIKNLAAGATGAKAIQHMGKKDTGNLLNRILEDRHDEAEGESPDRRGVSTGLEILTAETFIGPGFAQAHGLAGVVVADIVGFNFSEWDAWDVSQILAYLQMGMADIAHLLLACHLGCKWIASFDSDFVRCRKHIHDGMGLVLLATPEEILAAFRA